MAIAQTAQGGLTSLELAFLKSLVSQHIDALRLERDVLLGDPDTSVVDALSSPVMEHMDRRYRELRKLDDKLDVMLVGAR